MNISDIGRRNIGVNFVGGKAELMIWAPNADRVSLLLENAEQEMTPGDLGYWQLSTSELKPGSAYQIALDGKSLPDISSLSQPDVHGQSIALELNSFDWKDGSWQNADLSDYIIYELHTGAFTAEGTFLAAGEKLDHLVTLGVTAIELMPVAQFPGARNWGYDGVFPFAVQHSYGGAEGLIRLVDLCHQKGLAVIIDVVYNHLGPEGNYFGEYGPYFTEKYRTPWGHAINFDDAWCDPVRSFFIENALMWFRDFHVDALRMDAVHAIKDFSPKHILQEIREHTDRLMALTGKKHYLIVECDLNDRRFIDPVENGGYGMDAQWTDEFHHALRVAAGGEKDGYYRDFDGLSSLAESYTNAYVYHGQYSRQRKKYFGTETTGNPGQQFVVFSQNHDQVGNRMLGERSSHLFSTEMQKLMAAAIMISPFTPMLFMGEEWSSSSPFLYFVSHSDQALVKAVREGRKAEFSDFHGGNDAPDPQSEETFLLSKLKWDELLKEPHRNMMAYYRSLIELRRQQPALNNACRENMIVNFDANTQLLIVKRWCREQQLLCIMNFSKSRQASGMEGNFHSVRQIFNSADLHWQLQPAPPIFPKDADNIEIAPESITIYILDHV